MQSLADKLIAQGATLVGYGDISILPEDTRAGLPYGVVIAVALDPMHIANITNGPTPAYAAEYRRVNALLNALSRAAATLLREQGYRVQLAAATIDHADLRRYVTEPPSVVHVPHKTVATRAGLGWIGKCALLVTDQYGSAVRLTSLLTDAPLPVEEPIEASRCGDCVRCVEACPGNAPTGRTWHVGLPRQAIYNAQACYRTAQSLSARAGIEETICGICIAVCPWTQRYLRNARATQL